MLGAQHADTVEEIQVLTSNYSAEYGRASSGIVRMVTRSGTSQFHGTLNYLLQNDALNANTWSRNASGDPRLSKAAPWKLNQYGGTIGGPITIPGKFNTDRTRLFFFWGEEQLRRREETTQTLTVPSMAMRNGDFSELLNPANPFFNRARVITDPRTGQPFPGNIIPVDRMSPQGRALLGVYPQPTPGFLQGTLNHIATYPTWTSTPSHFASHTFRTPSTALEDRLGSMSSIPGPTVRLLAHSQARSLRPSSTS
jgi:hypothetical protein